MGVSRSFYLPTRVATGRGAQARALGQRALLVCNRAAVERAGFLTPCWPASIE